MLPLSIIRLSFHHVGHGLQNVLIRAAETHFPATLAMSDSGRSRLQVKAQKFSGADVLSYWIAELIWSVLGLTALHNSNVESFSDVSHLSAKLSIS